MSMHDHSSGPPPSTNWSRVNQWLLWVGLAAAVAWLFFGHGEHLLRLAPLLFLLACPLMHLFGHDHGGHGGHSNQPGSQNNDRNDDSRTDARPRDHVH